MGHDELLQRTFIAGEVGLVGSIRGVIKLHKPDLSRAYPVCTTCQEIYPCRTILAIEKELN